MEDSVPVDRSRLSGLRPPTPAQEPGDASPSPNPSVMGRSDKTPKRPVPTSNKKPKKQIYNTRCKPGGDALNVAAVENAYYVCHNVQDCLSLRGFTWPPDSKSKKPHRKR